MDITQNNELTFNIQTSAILWNKFTCLTSYNNVWYEGWNKEKYPNGTFKTLIPSKGILNNAS
jgi:hypothetical protein